MENIWEDFDFPTLDAVAISSAGSNKMWQSSKTEQKEILSKDNVLQYQFIRQDNDKVNNELLSETKKDTGNMNNELLSETKKDTGNMNNELLSEVKKDTDNANDENITYEDINWDDFPTF